jgi:hypothetical protein
VPEQVHRPVAETLGPLSLVFRDKVQKKLKLSDDQQKKLEKRRQDMGQDATQFFQNLQAPSRKDGKKYTTPTWKNPGRS